MLSPEQNVKIVSNVTAEATKNPDEIKKLLNKIEKLTRKKVHIISAVTKFGLDDLLSSIWNELGY